MKRAVILVGALALLLVLVRALPVLDWFGVVTGRLEELGVAGGLLYVLVYAALACVFVPGSVMSMVAGATWGLSWGVAIILPAATLATVIAAWLGRTMLRDLAERIMARYPMLAALDRVFGANALRFVTLLRLSPVLPFAASNYGLGTTSAPMGAIAAGTFVGLLPITVVWVYLGTLVGEAALTGAVPESPLRTALLVGGLAATVLIVVLLGRMARRQLQQDPPGRADRSTGRSEA